MSLTVNDDIQPIQENTATYISHMRTLSYFNKNLEKLNPVNRYIAEQNCIVKPQAVLLKKYLRT